MTLLVHLRVRSVGRLRVTAIVTIGTVVFVAVWGSILSHALRETWALRSVLRSGVVARRCRLVTDRRELGVRRGLSRDTNGLSHLTVDWSFTGRRTLVGTLLCIDPVTLIVSLALRLLLLFLCLPLFTDLLELYKASSQ